MIIIISKSAIYNYFYQKEHYIDWRENWNKIELNRNFCTKDFKNTSYEKLKKTFYSWKNCMSEPETLAVKNALDNFNFSEIISLHSQMKAFLLPDSWRKDKRVLNLQKKLKKVLPDYKENVEINKDLKEIKYTWLMENYIYEYKNIPTILIEFKKHWEKENRLLNLKKFL